MSSKESLMRVVTFGEMIQPRMLNNINVAVVSE